jgi:bifunctional aspartokinase / homoserine dehydrogenase 1
MYVLKFGGSSLASPSTISQVSSLLKERSTKEKLVVVLSAFYGITNQLLECGELASNGNSAFRAVCQQIRDRHIQASIDLIPEDQQSEVQTEVKALLGEFEELSYGVYLLGELSLQTKDRLISFGERLAVAIVTPHLISQGIKARALDSRKVILTDDSFGCAQVRMEDSLAAIKAGINAKDQVVVMAGFIGASQTGQTTTLGRGGSDFTAALVAASLKAKAMEKWTDVSGMLTADPRLVPTARVIEELTYSEAMELCHFGAKVIYPPTIHPLMENGIPLHVRNTFEPEAKGTSIVLESNKNGQAVRGLSSIGGIGLITIAGGGMVGMPGFSRRLFTALSYRQVNVILITQASSEHSITVGVQSSEADAAQRILEEEFEPDMTLGRIEPIKIETGLAIVALVGDKMRKHTGISGTTFHTLGRNDVNIRAIAQGSSERIISIVIEETDVAKSMQALHEAFFESELKRVNIFAVGVGNVGGTLIEQIKIQQDVLRKRLGIDLRVVALANSKKILIQEDGIDLDDWRNALKKCENNYELAKLPQIIKELNLRNSVFIDNTAHEVVSDLYPHLLSHSIAVIASNKIAASQSMDHYLQLKKLASKHHVPFLYETNVGAGLPIIDTIQNIVSSGDEITEIQAILSGSLNFIFNKFSDEVSFGEIVQQAMDGGYTEPDPRIDLSGVDVQRKILILAREAGEKMEMEAIENVPFLLQEVMEGKADGFLDRLRNAESPMKEKYLAAKAAGKKLKYAAQLKNGEAQVGLMEVAQDHPFFNIAGKDNIVLIYTKRYVEQPLVIKGAGAGAEVTAMGVFADIIRFANRQ